MSQNWTDVHMNLPGGHEKWTSVQFYCFNFLKYILRSFELVVGISESSNSRVSNQNSWSRLESLSESLESRYFQKFRIRNIVKWIFFLSKNRSNYLSTENFMNFLTHSRHIFWICFCFLNKKFSKLNLNFFKRYWE